MKKLILSLLLIPCISCLTTSEVYLPHTSRIFHKKNCVGLHDPNPIKYSSAQVALNTGGVAACSVCIKDKDLGVKNQGYTVTNYATSGSSTVSSNSQKLPPAKSKSSVVANVLSGILVTLGIVALAAASSAATPTQTYTPTPNFTVQPTYSGLNSGGYPSSNYNAPSSVFNTTTPSYSTSGTSNNIGGTTFHNFDNVSGTSNQIGNTTFHNFSDGTTGTSNNIGGTTFHNFSGNSGTSNNIGGY